MPAAAVPVEAAPGDDPFGEPSAFPAEEVGQVLNVLHDTERPEKRDHPVADQRHRDGIQQKIQPVAGNAGEGN